MVTGLTITMFLMDGTASGRIKCTIDDWPGIIYRIPNPSINIDKKSKYIEKCKDISALQHSGVYFLIGADKQLMDAIYVGQAVSDNNGRGVMSRIMEPHDSIEWTEAIIITTMDNTYGSTEISYLEHRFYNLAKKAHRYKVQNDNDPNLVNVTEETACRLDKFIENVRVVLETLGNRALEPINEFETNSGMEDKAKLHMKYKKVAEAWGKRTSKGFMIFKPVFDSLKS